MSREAICLRCGEHKEILGRGLCKKHCYRQVANRKELELYPRVTWKNSELLAELSFFQEQGLSVREAAEKIGVRLTTVRRAIQRARARQTTSVGV